MAKYILKEGITLHPFGETTNIDNTNLTDTIAEFLIESERATLEDFEAIEVEKPTVKTTKKQ